MPRSSQSRCRLSGPRTRYRGFAFVVFVAWLAGSAMPARAKVTFASPFGDHMVIQRDREIRLWGDADANARVDVSLGDARATATAGGDGRWATTLPAMRAGGPYTLSAQSGDSRAEVEDVLTGDVWLCSGQSNMAMRVRDCADDRQRADNADTYPALRLCTVGMASKPEPQRSASMKWQPATKEAALDFSAVGYFFATELLRDAKLSKVPVGIVVSSVGGTLCEAWISPEGLKNIDPKDQHLSLFGIAPGTLYNGMIAPLGPTAFKGVIWYQGEGNAGSPAIYPKLLRQMINDWRRQFDQPALPFLIIQLPDWADRNGQTWVWIRDAQRLVTACEPHTSLVVTLNTNNGWDLHPKEKHEVGRRAALVARHDVYGSQVLCQGPQAYDSHGWQRRDGEFVIPFEGDDGLRTTSIDGKVHGFTFAGPDGLYRTIAATVEDNRIVLRDPALKEQDDVRYAWSGVPGGTLTNRSGLPAWPFATSNPMYEDGTIEPVVTQSQQADLVLSTPRYELRVEGSGRIAGMVVGGKQFLSNETGPAGGSFIPGFLGSNRLLPRVRAVGPTRLTLADATLTFTIDGTENAMTWTFDSKDVKAVPFKINLSPLAEFGDVKDGAVMIQRGEVVLKLSPAKAVTRQASGAVVEVEIQPAGVTRVTWSFEAKP